MVFNTIDTNNLYKNYISDINKYKSLTLEEEFELRKRILNGDESAKEELALRHVKFVIQQARKHFNPKVKFLQLNDLINEGNFGLMVAINKFDYSKPNRFMTYAVYYINHYILTTIKREQLTIRLPNNPDWDSESLPKCYSLNNFFQKSDDDQLELIIKNNSTVSYEMEVKTNNIHKDTSSIIYELLDELTKDEKHVIKNYYGLIASEESYNLEEIGNEMSLSKERVRQIRDKALRKLRSKSYLLADLYQKNDE